MYSEPSSLSTYRVIAEPLVNIGEVKSSLIKFSPATTPSRKMRCSLKSEPPALAGGQFVDNETAWPFRVTLLIVESFSCPAILRQSRMIGVATPEEPAFAGEGA